MEIKGIMIDGVEHKLLDIRRNNIHRFVPADTKDGYPANAMWYSPEEMKERFGIVVNLIAR